MATFNPVYIARTREEYNELEKAWETLLQNYSFKITNPTIDNIEVKKDDIAGRIEISPKEGKIERIVLVGGLNTPARLDDMSSESVKVLIGETSYRINYNPKSK